MKKLKLTLVAIMAVIFYQAQEEISLDDYKFTTSVAKAGLMELKLGQLALANSSSPEIKTLGEQMIAHHTKTNKEIKKLADKRGIYLLADLDENQQKYYNKLAEKKGVDFDKALAKRILKDFKNEKGEFEKEIKKGQDPELKSWAWNTLQILESQLQKGEKKNDLIAREESFNYKY